MLGWHIHCIRRFSSPKQVCHLCHQCQQQFQEVIPKTMMVQYGGFNVCWKPLVQEQLDEVKFIHLKLNQENFCLQDVARIIKGLILKDRISISITNLDMVVVKKKLFIIHNIQQLQVSLITNWQSFILHIGLIIFLSLSPKRWCKLPNGSMKGILLPFFVQCRDHQANSHVDIV